MIQISPTQLHDWLVSVRNDDTKPLPIVLDVREPHEFELVSPKHDAAFELVRMPMRSVPQQLGQLDTTRPIACLCHHGGRSMQVAVFLENMGYTHVANISGGIDAWACQLDTELNRY